jgi:hypothetical protein
VARVKKMLMLSRRETISFRLRDADTSRNLQLDQQVPSHSALALIDLTCLTGRNVRLYQGDQLRIGSPLLFRTPLYQLQGTIVGFPSEEEVGWWEKLGLWEEQTMTLSLRSNPLMPETARLIRVGDHGLAQSGGRPAAVILAVKPLASTKLQVTFRIHCLISDAQCLYFGQPLKVGRPFTFETATYDLGGVITALAPAEEP